jgi:hypothetical protein
MSCAAWFVPYAAGAPNPPAGGDPYGLDPGAPCAGGEPKLPCGGPPYGLDPGAACAGGAPKPGLG